MQIRRNPTNLKEATPCKIVAKQSKIKEHPPVMEVEAPAEIDDASSNASHSDENII
jgi:hypothetical protein